MHKAVQSDIYSDVPGDCYIEAKQLVDSAIALCRTYHVSSSVPDSLNSELIPRLEATRRAVEARLKVVEGIRYAEQPLLRQLTRLDSILAGR